MTILSAQEFTNRILEIAGDPVKCFEPFVFHNTEGDCIEFFVSRDDYYAERIDDYLTLYLCMDTDQVVGFVIKNVKRILDRLSSHRRATAFVIDDGKIRLRSLFTSLFMLGAGEHQNHDLLVIEYVKAVRIAESYQLDEVKMAYA